MKVSFLVKNRGTMVVGLLLRLYVVVYCCGKDDGKLWQKDVLSLIQISLYIFIDNCYEKDCSALLNFKFGMDNPSSSQLPAVLVKNKESHIEFCRENFSVYIAHNNTDYLFGNRPTLDGPKAQYISK
ncbi:unnamed protein product [Vicia faba]|uniref:Uncharacterized protein n=1 Tax=Vicia faba TaxID=3906 RepID=A0AAV0YYG9_VICFA|nr:unnamed protein product [Vicia faba]